MPGQSFRSILVCIEAPAERQQPALRRAAAIAKQTGARLTLFHSDFVQFIVAPAFQSAVLRDDSSKQLAGSDQALRRMAAGLKKQGVRATVRTAWDRPPHEAIVREVLRSKPDLVVAGSRRRAFGERLLLTNTDWQLIRQCPVPLLFVKQKAAYRSTRVLAAIDPMYAHGRPASLDRSILEAARALSAALGGRLDVVHAHAPLSSHMPDGYGGAFGLVVDSGTEQKYLRAAQRAVERTTARLGLPAARLHFETGDPQTVLPAVAQRLRADVVVMGAVSRSVLGRILIGSTAERTLDRLPCDVMIIKPRGFRTRVPRRME